MLVDALTGNKGRDHDTTTAGCGSCGSLWRLKCGSQTDDSRDSTLEHQDCTHGEARARDEMRKQQLPGLIGGVDYQICSGFKALVEHPAAKST